ncbi:GPI anchored protein, putative [Talaromyces stipitatus ATCC 10500]|uniref:GPI anchored protein, putative n=1 Tax=Talaromyces stipitatus (strain ATCC 10500 / CBS 375.48 / QM 6759 / NRRL 1006) TaxID=441959 RepID=B8MDX6_TALSN|nr:GPI anchored protein, putative [Talaromyces stipitatus ATCC 10500]EED16053.1 GPI anchored protein, putative [Talaromyces stipitatus ATCC 10500]
MRLLSIAFGLLATLSLSAAQTSSNPKENAFIVPSAGAQFTAGTTTTLTWNPTTSGTISLRLQWGATTVATDGVVIASAIKNTGSYEWDVPSNIPKESDYFIRISSDADSSIVNYSARFDISGVSGSASTTTSASATSTSASSSSSSSTSSSSSSSSSSSTKSSSTTSSSSSSTSTTLVTSSSTAAVPSSTAASTTSASSTSAAASKTSATATTAPSIIPNLSGAGEIKIPFVMAGIAAFGAYALL